MDNNGYFYNTIFKNKLLECHGDMFQQFFYSIMDSTYQSFRKIEPQGSYGDRKCDGYRFGEGVFYQVYGPKDTYTTNKDVQKRAIAKMNEDFQGLKEQVELGFWEPIKEFHFVFNSKRGFYPELDEELRKLQDSYSHITFGIKDRDYILKLFSNLDEFDKSNICGCNAPDIKSSLVSYAIIGDIIGYMVSEHNFCTPSEKMILPDFIDKIEFNELNPYYGSSLTIGNYRVSDLNVYLASYPGDIEEYLCSIYALLYLKAKEKYPDDQNLQCQYLVDNSFDKENIDNNSTLNYVSNIFIVLSKYFETCDIFEEPK